MDYYSDCPEFGGCPSNDEIAAVRDPKKFYIVNMSPRKDGGSHWTLLFQDLYFDSFGCAPTTAVEPFVKVWNATPYQDFHSSACGFYCIYVADNILAGRRPEEGLIPDDEETPTRNSELVLRKYFQEHNDQFKAGEGFFSKLVDRFRPRKAESKRLRKFLDTEGNQEVSKIEIARIPVQSFVQKALNAVSLGKLYKKRDELGYDDIYHNYLLVTMKNGKTYRVEHNHQVEAKPATASDLKGQRSNVPMTKTKTLKEMIEVAAKDDPKLFTYDARTNNCQDFTRKVLTKNGLKPENDPPQQDAKQLTETLPFQGKLAKVITDVAQYADQVVHGGSVRLDKWY